MEFIDLKSQYQHLKSRIDTRIQSVLAHGQYIMGPEVFELEANLEEFIGIKHAITCANGTDALTLALMAIGAGEGDAIFCPTFTFFSTGEVISFANAEPIFVDSEKKTFNICADNLEKQILKVIKEGRLVPKAVIAVDLFGLPANYPKIEKICKKYNLKLIEDAAQGFGGSIDGKKAGSFGDIATTSFFPAKPLGCYGDGGAIFTDNEEYANLIKSLRVHGKGAHKYDNIRIGMNSRLDTIQAAILIEKLQEFPNELVNRNKLAEKYQRILPKDYNVPIIEDGFYSSWAQFTLVHKNREKIIKKYEKKSIPTNIYYSKCLHQQEAFNDLDCKEGDYPIAEELALQVFSLPMHGYSHVEIDRFVV